MSKKHTLQHLFLVLALISIFFSCNTTKKYAPPPSHPTLIEEKREEAEPSQRPLKKPLKITLSGDLMCHTENAKTASFDAIYESIKPILKNDDLTFTNLETPVDNNKDYQSFPSFNVKNAYVDAALDAGIEVFSLANNHTNDQNKDGIQKTLSYFESLSQKEVYYSGIHKKNNEENLSYSLIEKNGWKILFASYTEILNRSTGSGYIDYFPATEKKREELYKKLLTLQQNNKHDIFILSVHSCEPEYILTVSESRRKFYKTLTELGVDILWSNHPHVPKKWENIRDSKTLAQTKLITYCLGNLISGQRRPWPNLKNPAEHLEYTGDSYLLQVEIYDDGSASLDEETSFYIGSVKPLYITTHITKWMGDYVIEKLDKEFIEQQSPSLKKYYKERLNLMEKIKGITIWD